MRGLQIPASPLLSPQLYDAHRIQPFDGILLSITDVCRYAMLTSGDAIMKYVRRRAASDTS